MFLSKRRWLFAGIFCAYVGLQASSAFAEPIVLVRPSDESPSFRELFVRLKGELKMQGFDAQVVEVASPMSFSEMRDRALASEARASVAIELHKKQAIVRVLFVDATYDYTDELTITESLQDDTMHDLPLRTIESLRSGLLERAEGTKTKAAPRRLVAPVPRNKAAVVQATPPNQFLDGRLLVGPSWGSFSRRPLAIASVSLGLRFHHRLSLAAEASLPITAMEVGTTRATARYRIYRVNGELRLREPFIAEWLTLECGLGLGVSHVAAAATTDGSLVGYEPSVWIGTGFIGVGAWVKLGSSITVGGLGRLSALLPKVVVEVDNKRATLGYPSGEALLGATWLF